MGREARARATTKRPKAASTPAPIKLDAADYWEMRSRTRDVEAVEYDLLRERQAGLQRLEAAKSKFREVFARLAKKYQLPEAGYGWNDETLELIPQALPAGVKTTTGGST